MGMSEKLQSIAEAQQKIHSAGQLSILGDSAYLSGSEVGNVITANDVTPIEHNLDITLRSKNLFDITNPKTCGYNTYSLNYPVKIENGIIYSGGVYATSDGTYIYISTYSYDTITFSFKFENNETSPNKTGFAVRGWNEFNETGLPANSVTIYSKNGMDNGHQAVTINVKEYDYVGIAWFASIQNKAKITELQIELGDTTTEYTPYVSDFSNVKVTRTGKNFFDTLNAKKYSGSAIIAERTKDLITVEKNITTTWISANFELPLSLSGKKVTISAKVKTSGKNMGGIRISPTKVNGGISTAGIMRTGVSSPDGFTNLVATGVLPEIVEGQKMLFLLYSNSTATDLEADTNYSATYKDIQIEISDTQTEYEPYIEPQTVTANADGTVEGIKNLSPNMCLYTDTDGVNIDCKYYRDIDYYIDNLTTNVALTGGE